MIIKNIFFITSCLLLTSCGSLTLSPSGCPNKGLWGSEQKNEVLITEDYYLWGDDTDIRLHDFLDQHGVKCEQIKSLRVKITTTFFVKRTVEVYYIATAK